MCETQLTRTAHQIDLKDHRLSVLCFRHTLQHYPPKCKHAQLDDRGANHEGSLDTGRIWWLIRTEQDGSRSISTIQGRMPLENARVMMLQVVGLSWQSMHAAASMVLDHLGIRDVGRHKMGLEYKLKNLSTVLHAQ